MPLVSELVTGSSTSRTFDEGGMADSNTRVFRVLLTEPSEGFDIQEVCGVSIGDAHPSNPPSRCYAYESRAEGDSRLSVLCTFNYRAIPSAAASGDAGGVVAGGGSDPLSISPNIRPANWTTSVATYEVPVSSWKKVTKAAKGWVAGARSPAVNPAKDLYDGISRLCPLVTISVEQFYTYPALRFENAAGCINSKDLIVGGVKMPPGTVLLRSISSQPDVVPWGRDIYRGWKVSFEFLYKHNPVDIWTGTASESVNIGWDVAIPQSGFNCKAFNPAAAGATQDPWGQPLKHTNYKVADPLALFEKVSPGDKVRAMVKVFSYTDGGASQTPSAQPIALNDDGTPRKDTADPPVLVYRYRVYEEYDFTTLDIRLNQ
jgi:hypothetical protein